MTLLLKFQDLHNAADLFLTAPRFFAAEFLGGNGNEDRNLDITAPGEIGCAGHLSKTIGHEFTATWAEPSFDGVPWGHAAEAGGSVRSFALTRAKTLAVDVPLFFSVQMNRVPICFRNLPGVQIFEEHLVCELRRVLKIEPTKHGTNASVGED